MGVSKELVCIYAIFVGDTMGVPFYCNLQDFILEDLGTIVCGEFVIDDWRPSGPTGSE